MLKLTVLIYLHRYQVSITCNKINVFSHTKGLKNIFIQNTSYFISKITTLLCNNISAEYEITLFK